MSEVVKREQDSDFTIVTKFGYVDRIGPLYTTKAGRPITTCVMHVGRPEATALATAYEVVLAGALGENAVKSLVPGDQIIVVGKLQIEVVSTADGMRPVARKLYATSIGPDLRHGPWQMTERSG